MKTKLKLFAAGLALTFLLTACGEAPELTRFKNDMDAFCTKISEIDTAINSIDANSDTAVSELLTQLDLLDTEFQKFADLDFPEEFDYLEGLADEAGSYMTEAVSSYHEAYSNGSYNEYLAEYAYENYSRANKRILIIVSLLHGEEPEDVDLVAATDEPGATE